MNKRHYEHTLPNIRGSLSNTYDEAAGKLQEDNSFETPLYKLRFTDASGYGSNSDIFTISNRYLLEEFIKFMKKKIQSKIEELEQLLISE